MRYKEFKTESVSRAKAEQHAKWVKDTKQQIAQDEASRMNIRAEEWHKANSDIADGNWRFELEDKIEQHQNRKLYQNILRKLGHPPSDVQFARMKAYLEKRRHERFMKHQENPRNRRK